MLDFILSMTPSQAREHGRTADAATHARISFLSQRIKSKDYKSLIKYIRTERGMSFLKDDYDRYSPLPVAEIDQIVTAVGPMLPLSAHVVACFLTEAARKGDPITLDFEQPAPDHVVEDDLDVQNNDAEFLDELFEGLTTDHITLLVSEWAEKTRYLPKSVTPLAGFYSFSVTPYLKEIADCFSITSNVREVHIMKGAQVGATVGVLENIIGYYAEHVIGTPMMLLTAEREMAKKRVDVNILPMFKHSGIDGIIQSSDDDGRRTGKTEFKIEFLGGGYLLPYGAKNANKLRSDSIRVLLGDEIDAYPDNVGKDGDPLALAEARLQAYYQVRKECTASTPLLKGSSRIAKKYETGDKRNLFVPCTSCGGMQVLVFTGDPELNDGKPFGFTWEYNEDGRLDYDSVRYVCKFCGHKHRNDDKAFMLPRGEWRPTAVPSNPYVRSYHLPGFYSPPSQFTWEAIVEHWLSAWDPASSTAKDIYKLQTFYNNILGVPFKFISGGISFRSVSGHRRPQYRRGEVPNKFATLYCGSFILFLVCTVDVHKRKLYIGVFGVTRDFRIILIDYIKDEAQKGEADATEIDSPLWGRLQSIIEEQAWIADDGKVYGITLTLIDAGFSNDTVTSFCAQYARNVYPILGRDRPAKNQSIKEFAPFETKSGTQGYRIMVDHYKDRLAPVLRRQWLEETSAVQKRYHFNAPVDLTDDELKELIAEEFKEKADDRGLISYYWHRPNNKPNELWDLLVYANAAVEIVAYTICREHFELETVNWPDFWDYIQFEAPLYREN